MAFTFKDFQFDASKVKLDDALKGTGKVPDAVWAQYFLGEGVMGSPLFTKPGADNPYYKALGDRINKVREAGADEDTINQLTSLQADFLASGSSGSVKGGNVSGLTDWGTSDYGEAQKIKQWGTAENERAAAQRRDDLAGTTSNLFQQFYLTEAAAYERQNQKKIYEAEKDLAQGQYQKAEQDRVFAEQKEQARQQQVLFQNQQELRQVNTDAQAQQGTGLASRLLGASAQEAETTERSVGSSAPGLSSAVGLSTVDDEKKKRRGLSAAVGINV